MSTPARRRVLKDYKDLQKDPPFGIIGAPHEDNLMQWHVIICGPEDTIWEGGTFALSLEFTEEYPSKAPHASFITKIFHPNVYTKNGDICLDILQKNWSSAYSISAILTSIQSLLPDPNTMSPANVEAAKLFNENKAEYYRKVIASVQNSWLHQRGTSNHDDECK